MDNNLRYETIKRGISIPRVLFRAVDDKNINGAECIRYAHISLLPPFSKRVKYAFYVLTGKLKACEIENRNHDGKFFTL